MRCKLSSTKKLKYCKLYIIICFPLFIYYLMANNLPLAKLSSCCVEDSRVTNTTSQFKCIKKFSLESCRSMVSVEDNATKSKYFVQRAVFFKFMMSKKNSENGKKYLQKLRLIFLKMDKQKIEQISKKVNCSIEKMPEQFNEEDKYVFNFFMALWIDNMGYRSEQNKKMILERLHQAIPPNLVLNCLCFYETLGAKKIKGQQRYQMLLKLCTNGWEFFCQLMVSHARHD